MISRQALAAVLISAIGASNATSQSAPNEESAQTTLVQEAYLKASNTRGTQDNAGARQEFGNAMAFSRDTVVVGTYGEASDATGVNGDQRNIRARNSGAAYVFVRNGGAWAQQAYLKASNTRPGSAFGEFVAISGDTIAVSSTFESSSASGVNGDERDTGAPMSGAVYVFVRRGTVWTQQAYLKPSNNRVGSNLLRFGYSLAIFGDTIAVGTPYEQGRSVGVDGSQLPGGIVNSGAVYIFVRNGTTWFQQAYLKPPVVSSSSFGFDLALSGDTLVVGAYRDNSNATGADGNPAPGQATESGAAHVFVRDGNKWRQQAFLKASNARMGDRFGWTVAISGEMILVGAPNENGGASGVNGDQNDRGNNTRGAAYVFSRAGTTWKQEAYLKPSLPRTSFFGGDVDLDGEKLLVSSSASGPPPVERISMFERIAGTWRRTVTSDRLGSRIAIFGETVVRSDSGDNSSATGVNGNANNQNAPGSGAVYVFRIKYPPTASDQTETAIPGVRKKFPLKLTSPGGVALKLSTITGPARGNVEYDNETLQAIYTPDVAFMSGSDSFTYSAADDTGLTATASVRIELLDDERAPLKLLRIESALDNSECIPDSLFRIDATWRNSGPPLSGLVASVLLNTGGTVEGNSLIPVDGIVETDGSISGQFTVRLRDCESFRFHVGLFSGAEAATSGSPAGYVGGFLFNAAPQ